jgi:beta-glucosidase
MQEQSLKELLDNLTLEEKIGQLVQLSADFYTQDEALKVGPEQKLGISKEDVRLSGSVLNVTGAKKAHDIQENYLKNSRHKIPLLFMADVVYGYKTIYPIPLGIGASWNPELIREGYEMTSAEAKAAGVHVTFSPMTDLVRDARWGRCLESTGEDTWLNSRFAEAMVKGFQGDNLDENNGIASCVKHFAAYGAAEAGREYNTVDISERRLREEYLPSYKAAVDAGCELVMTSFNTIDEIPATANTWLMDEVLRKEWGFDGVVITDYAAVQELIMHGVAADMKEATELAFKAGVDIDMKTACYATQLKPLIEEGRISEEKLDEAVWRILKLKNKLGLFEDPFRGASEEAEKDLCCCESHRKKARQISGESIVLLKNEGGILPLKADGKKVALIGPYAESSELTGLWAVHANMSDTVTVRSAIEEVIGAENLVVAKGCDYLEDESSLGIFGSKEESATDDEAREKEAVKKWSEALNAAQEADVIIMTLGEHPMQSGEGGSRTNIGIPENQVRLFKEVKSFGKPIILVTFSGRPLVLSDVADDADAILEAWYPGTEGAHAIADILYGKVNPSGRLAMSFPRAVGQLPIYYNGFQTGRPNQVSSHSNRFTSRYLDCPNDPLYVFGYGLSYHESEYSEIELSSATIRKGGTISASVEVTNKSSVDGLETVQMYIRDVTGSVVRPIKELKGFKKVMLKAGETIKITFEISEEMLRFHTKDMSFKSEAGKFILMIGKNSADVKIAEFILE